MQGFPHRKTYGLLEMWIWALHPWRGRNDRQDDPRGDLPSCHGQGAIRGQVEGKAGHAGQQRSDMCDELVLGNAWGAPCVGDAGGSQRRGNH
jgi:hypothetical protein